MNEKPSISITFQVRHQNFSDAANMMLNEYPRLRRWEREKDDGARTYLKSFTVTFHNVDFLVLEQECGKYLVVELYS